jgi:hypothetical protein
MFQSGNVVIGFGYPGDWIELDSRNATRGFFIVPNKGMGTGQRKTCYVIIYNLFIHFPYKEKESFETSLSQIWLYPNQN